MKGLDPAAVGPGRSLTIIHDLGAVLDITSNHSESPGPGSMSDDVNVYRFICEVGDLRIAPPFVQGTPEAIGRLAGCRPLPDSGTRCNRALLEDGFLFLE